MPSFMAFIDNDGCIMEADEDSDAGDDSDDTDTGSDSAEGENGDEVEDEDEGDEAEDEDKPDEATSAETGNDTPDGETATEDPRKTEDAEKAPGWYVLYGLKIKGMKETKAIDALKQFGSNFLKGFGITLSQGWGGGNEKKITVGGVLDAKDKLMGIIKYPDDTIKLADGVTKDIQKRFPSLPHVDSMFRDNKTVISEIEKNGGKNAYPEYDGKVKQKIESAPYVLYIHVEGDDPKAPLLNRKEIASIITNNIKGLIAKASNNISAEKVIYLHGKALEGRGDHYGDRQAKAKLPNNLELLEILGDKPADPKTFKSLDIFKRMSDKFKSVAKDKKQKENEDIKALLDIWDKFYEEHQDDPKSITYGEFEAFIQKYHAEYKKRFQKKTNESVSIRLCMMRNLFESFNDNDIQDIMFEDDDANKANKDDTAKSADANANDGKNTSENKDKNADNSDSDENKNNNNGDVYFAVPKDLNKTDSLDESGIDFLEGSPVKKSDITDDVIEDMTARAKAKLVDLEEKLNESFVSNTTRNMLTDLFGKPGLHEAEEEESGDDTADEGDSGYEFDKWNPDPKTISEPNIELKGKKEMVVVAQFKKKDGSSGTDSDATPEIDSGSDLPGEDGDETENSGGDDLYIVPMPNVKFEKNGDNDWNDKNND